MLANNFEKRYIFKCKFSDITIGSPPVLSHNTHRFLLSSSFSPKEPKKGHHKPYAYSTDMEYNRRFVLGNLNRHTVHSYKCIGGINALKGTNRKLTAISFSVPKTSADFLAIDFTPLGDKPFGPTNLTSILKENQPDFSTNSVPLSQQNDLYSPVTNTETETGDHVKIRHHQSSVSRGDHTAGPKKSQLISSTALPLYETDGNILIMTNNAGPSSSVVIGSPKLVSESNSSNRSSSQNIQSVDGLTQTIAPKSCDDQTINTEQHVLPQNENVDQTTAFEKYNDPKIASVEFGLLHSSDDLDSSAAEDELLNDPPSYKCVAPITQTMLKYCPDYVTTNMNITTPAKPSKTETADIETRDDAILEKVTYVLTLHPKYFEKFYRMHNFLLKGNFSLSYADRHFIALMAVSCYNCRPLMVNQMREFLNSGGDMDWLFDSEAIPQKMKNLFEINKLLAHQPWRIDRALIKHVMRNDLPQNNWNPGELVFAITLLTHFQGLCSLVFGCAWLYDLTQQAFHATLTQLYGDYRKKHGLYNISGEGLTSNEQSNKNSLLTDTPLSYPLQTSNINPNSSTPLLNRKVLLVSTTENENSLIEPSANDDLQLNTVDEGEDCLEAFEEVTVDALITKMKVLHQKIRAQDLDNNNENYEMFPGNTNIEMAQDVNTISPATPSSQKAIDIALAMTIKPEPPQTTLKNYTFESTLETANVIKNPNFNVLLSSPQSGITSDEDNTTTNSSCPSSLLLQFDETNLRRTNNFKDENKTEDWRNKLKRDGSNLTEVLDLVKASTFISADETFSYVDFAKRDHPSQAPTFRIQDYSWEHHGYALVNRLCPELSNLLDDKFRMAYHLTYSTMGCVSNVDTSMFRRAIWNYIHSAYGIRHDDYDYSQVNQLLTRNLKMVIKTLTCYPQRILAPTFCDACYNIVIHNKDNKNENYDKMENKGKKSPKLFRIESVPETSLNKNNRQSFATKIENSSTNPPHGKMNKNKKSGQTHSTNTKKRGKNSNNGGGNEGTKSSPLSKRSSSTSSSLEFCIKEGFMRDFLESEKVHVNLMIMDAKIQAANLYALRAIMQFMS